MTCTRTTHGRGKNLQVEAERSRRLYINLRPPIRLGVWLQVLHRYSYSQHKLPEYHASSSQNLPLRQTNSTSP